ncbi:MAG: CPBP family intramembrane metalloprotease [Chloroflexi bacterium]|nr:CPBP family intramembrane metalloprotease [Chloroflexota bacterium]
MATNTLAFRLKRVRDEVFETGVTDEELTAPKFTTVLKVVWNAVRAFRMERTAQIFGSAFVLLMLWGFHGNLELLTIVVPGWRGPGVEIGARPQLIPGLPWDNELISFWAGALLVVVVPMFLIKRVFKEDLAAYGLGLPAKGRRKLAVQAFVVAMVLGLIPFLAATGDADMRATYPFYRPFTSVGQFAIYELTYLPFFIAIEFIFRGYLLFGLARIRDRQAAGTEAGVPGVFFFGRYALLIQMLSYTAWHLGKPLPELWGTLAWGLAAGVVAYTVRSIWPVVLSHWLLNVIFDAIVASTL